MTVTDALLQRRDLLQNYKVNTPIRLAYFLTTAAAEAGFFKARYDNLNYSDSRLKIVFPILSQKLDLSSYQHNPEKIANLIYSNEMGNGDAASGDGWKYRGRGLLVLTGKANYSVIGKRIGLDLLTAPDLLSDPEADLAVALDIWSMSGANTYADADDVVEVTRRIDGGVFGLALRKSIFPAAKVAVGLTLDAPK